LVALSRSSSGYFLGAAMLLILPWIQSLHQTRGDSTVGRDAAPRDHFGAPNLPARTSGPATTVRGEPCPRSGARPIAPSPGPLGKRAGPHRQRALLFAERTRGPQLRP